MAKKTSTPDAPIAFETTTKKDALQDKASHGRAAKKYEALLEAVEKLEGSDDAVKIRNVARGTADSIRRVVRDVYGKRVKVETFGMNEKGDVRGVNIFKNGA